MKIRNREEIRPLPLPVDMPIACLRLAVEGDDTSWESCMETLPTLEDDMQRLLRAFENQTCRVHDLVGVEANTNKTECVLKPDTPTIKLGDLNVNKRRIGRCLSRHNK